MFRALRWLVVPDSALDTLSVIEIKTRVVAALSLSLKPRQLQLLQRTRAPVSSSQRALAALAM